MEKSPSIIENNQLYTDLLDSKIIRTCNYCKKKEVSRINHYFVSLSLEDRNTDEFLVNVYVVTSCNECHHVTIHKIDYIFWKPYIYMIMMNKLSFSNKDKLKQFIKKINNNREKFLVKPHLVNEENKEYKSVPDLVNEIIESTKQFQHAQENSQTFLDDSSSAFKALRSILEKYAIDISIKDFLPLTNDYKISEAPLVLDGETRKIYNEAKDVLPFSTLASFLLLIKVLENFFINYLRANNQKVPKDRNLKCLLSSKSNWLLTNKLLDDNTCKTLLSLADSSVSYSNIKLSKVIEIFDLIVSLCNKAGDSTSAYERKLWDYYDTVFIPKKRKKPFLTIDEQIKSLNDKGLKIGDEKRAAIYLKNYNYQNFINGYNTPFLKGFRRTSNAYSANATFEGIIDLFNFDRSISSYCISNLQNFERILNSSIVRIVCSKMKEHGCDDGLIFKIKTQNIWNAIFGSNFKNQWKTLYNLKKICTKFFNKYRLWSHCEQWDLIPIWSIFVYLDFSEVISFFSCLDNELKKEIIEDIFEDPDYLKPDIFINICKNFNLLRDRCCHNNVVFDYYNSSNDCSNL